MSQRVDYHWVQQELIPFLKLAYESGEDSPKKTIAEWETEVRRAEDRINTIRNYDDSIITIDRIRLALCGSAQVDDDDAMQAALVANDPKLCLTLFVRHAVTHGPYPLVSLGIEPGLDALRKREELRQTGKAFPNTYKPLTNPRTGAYVGSANKDNFDYTGTFPVFNTTNDHVERSSRKQHKYRGRSKSNGRYYQNLPWGLHGSNTTQDNYGGYPNHPFQYDTAGMNVQYHANAPQPQLSVSAVADYNLPPEDNGMPLWGQNQGMNPAGFLNLHVHAPEFIPGATEHHTLN